jgi:hypothetical protein
MRPSERNYKKIRSGIKYIFQGEIYKTRFTKKLPDNSLNKYVAALFLTMDKNGLSDILLKRDEPLLLGLSGYEDELFENVTYSQVSERLKVMANLTEPIGKSQIPLMIDKKKRCCIITLTEESCFIELKSSAVDFFLRR